MPRPLRRPPRRVRETCSCRILCAAAWRCRRNLQESGPACKRLRNSDGCAAAATGAPAAVTFGHGYHSLFGQHDLSIDPEVAADRGCFGARLPTANRRCIVSLRDDNVPTVRDHAQIARLEVKRNLLTRPRREMKALETA